MYAKKGDYVVLLASCDGKNCWRNIPINYVYKLREDCNIKIFSVEKDIKGYKNGWSAITSGLNPHLKISMATSKEIKSYNIFDKPCSIHNIITINEHDI